MVKLRKPSLLDMEIESCLRALRKEVPGSENYQKIVTNLSELNAIKGERKHLSPDAALSAGIALTQVGLLLWHEQLHTITGKAISFVTKPRF